MVNAASRRAAAPAIAVAATLGLAAAAWAAAAALMQGMDMGIATRPGPFGLFAVAWVAMMAAMMLPGAAPAVARNVRRHGQARAALWFAGSYLAVWALGGVAAYALDLPHGPLAAGVVAIAAGIYELTPVSRRFRRRCYEEDSSGLRFGLCCFGSSAGLMATLVAMDVMSLFWMAVVTVLACAQKLLPAMRATGVATGMALIGLGLGVIFAPSLIPGLMPHPM